MSHLSLPSTQTGSAYRQGVEGPVLFYTLLGSIMRVDVVIEFLHGPRCVLFHIFVVRVLLLNKLKSSTKHM